MLAAIDTRAARSDLTKLRSKLRIQKRYELAMFASRLIGQLEEIEKPSTPDERRADLWKSFQSGLRKLHSNLTTEGVP